MRCPLPAALIVAVVAALITAVPAAGWAQAFPPASRPVADIVTNRWSDEEAREAAGEADSVIRLAGVRPGMRVADIGAGEGYYTVKLARAVGPRGQVLAEDIVPRYVEGLEARVRRLGLSNVRVILGEPDDARLPAASLDRAFLVHMYHEIAEPYALMWRLHGAMRPGGIVAIVDSDRPTGSHGTPPRLLRCELGAVGFTQLSVRKLGKAGGYLALFEARAPRPEPSAIRPCANPGRR